MYVHLCIYRACAREAEDIVKFILSKSDVQPLPNLRTGESPLHAACERGNYAIASLLLDHSPKLLLEKKSDQKTALHLAAARGDQKIVSKILACTVEIVTSSNHVYSQEDPFSLDFHDSDGLTPFYLACLGGYEEVVKEFLDLKSNPSLSSVISLSVNALQNGHTCLHAAASSGSPNTVECLLSLGDIDTESKVQPSMQTKEALLNALQGGSYRNGKNMKIFEFDSGELIVDQYGPPKGSKPLCLSPLAEACVYNSIAVVDVFLKFGVRDNDGIACRVALVMENYKLAQRLLVYDCTVLEREKQVPTPKRGKGKGRESEAVEDTWSVKLGWDGKKLPLMRGEWIGPSARFFPTVLKEDFDELWSSNEQRRESTYGAQPPPFIKHNFIRNVTLKSNNLKEVPLQLFQLVNVVKIDLSNNKLVTLPTEKANIHSDLCGWECNNLQHLKLCENELAQLPSSVWFLPKLKTLEATKNQLFRLAPTGISSIGLAHKLSKIDFSHNDLKEIELFLTELPLLQTAHFCHNKLKTIPVEMWLCSTLHELYLDHNQITSLVPSTSLTASLSIESDTSSHEDFTFTLPAGPAVCKAHRVTAPQVRFKPQMSNCASIDPQKSIDADAMFDFDRVRYKFGMGAGWSQEDSSLIKLDLTFNKFESFPKELPCVAPSLQELNISSNSVGEIELRLLPPSLKKLIAKHCQIRRFGSILNKEQFDAIRGLCIFNRFKSQPCPHLSHFQLPDLSFLNLSHNCLTDFQILYHQIPRGPFPDFAAEEKTYEKQVGPQKILFPSLETLYLSHNNLQGLFNPNVGHLTMLKSVHLDNNALREIPFEFGYLRRMKGFTELVITDLPNLVQPPKDYQTETCTCSQLLTYLAAGLKQ